MKDYEVISPDKTFKDKGYSDWIQDWSNWFYQPYSERNNDGDVVFLRSLPLSEGNYQNEANVRIGNEALEITEDQVILIPIITATFIADEGQSPEWLYGMARSNISNGDNPPKLSQLKINKEDIVIDGEKDFAKYEFETPVYQIHIPDAPPGVSLKHQVEYPMESFGYFPAVTRGYFVMLKLKTPADPKSQNIYVHCEATGETTPRGPYNVSLFYEIKVGKSPAKAEARDPPSRLTRSIAVTVKEKHKKGQVTDPEFERIKDILGQNEFVVNEDNINIEKIVEIMKAIENKGAGRSVQT
jgi:hypothetical protein